MNILTILLVSTILPLVGHASINLPKSRLQQTCDLIVSNTEQNKTENTLPRYSEHYYLMIKINSYLNTLHTTPPPYSYLYLNSSNSGVVSTNADGSSVVLAKFPTSGGLSTFGLLAEKVQYLALAHNISVWPIDAFTGCSALEAITAFGKEIDAPFFQVVRAHFEGCPNLKHIHIPSSVEVGDGEENSAENLKSVFPHSLQSVVFPASTHSIGYFAFYDCSELTSVNLSKCVKLEAFKGKGAYSHCFACCSKLTSIDLSNCKSLVTTHRDTVAYCPNIHSLDFSGCLNIQNIEMGFCCSSVQKGGESLLLSVVFPVSLKEIGLLAFSCNMDGPGSGWQLSPHLRTLIWKGRSFRSTINISDGAFGLSKTLDDLVNEGIIQEIFIP